MNKKIQSFLLRLSIVIIFHLLFKLGDQTFTGPFEPGLRSIVFSFYFIFYWMLFWKASSMIYNMLTSNSRNTEKWYSRLSFVTLILFIFVIAGSTIFSWGYSFIDHIFGIKGKEDVSFLNPEIFGSFDIPGSINLNPELLFGFILFFILVYGTHIFISSMKNVKEMEVVAALQKKESITAQYAALKNQIDPHFFFNSLSVLSSLIYENTELSSEYISHLSKHYRYILDTNTDNLISVDKELDILDSYYFLIKIRYPEYIYLSVDLTEKARSNCKILPHSILMLVENAVKHNVFTKDNQLVIEIFEDDEYIIVRNNMNKRRLSQESTGIGLQNIRKRYGIESNKEVLIMEHDNYFVAKLPRLS